jgi:ribosomal protein S17E
MNDYEDLKIPDEALGDFKQLINSYLFDKDTSSIIKAITLKLNRKTTKEVRKYIAHFITNLVKYIYKQTYQDFFPPNIELRQRLEDKIYNNVESFIYNVIYKFIGSLAKSNLPEDSFPQSKEYKEIFYRGIHRDPGYVRFFYDIQFYFIEQKRSLLNEAVLRYLPGDVTNLVSGYALGDKSNREKTKDFVHNAMVHRPNFDPNIPDLITAYATDMGFRGRKSPIRRGSPGRRKSPIRRDYLVRRKSPIRRGSR